MKKQIRGQIYRIALVYILLAALVSWQWHFVSSGLHSNIYLNGLIIAVFLLGTVLVIKSFIGVYNEERAFAALQEAYSDIQQQRHRSDDALWRHDRCFKAGIVFKRPKLLGHIYDLTMEELQRTKHMRLSIATMQNLLNAVDAKMAHDRAVQGYITGLLVFLGLIGTFIGLMEMVHSVGGIIGGLANADAASADSVRRLIHDLEAPLVGMAQGFSSSLFGLFTSLVLGIVMRFGMVASYSVKEEFESWLANVSQLENESSVDAAGTEDGSGASPGTASTSALLGAIRRSNRAIDRTMDMLGQLVIRQGEQADLIRQTCIELDRVSRGQAQSNAELAKIDSLRADIAHARGDFFRVGDALEARVNEHAARTESELSSLARAGERRADGLAAIRSELSEAIQRLDRRFVAQSEAAMQEFETAHRDQMTAIETLAGRSTELQASIGAAEQLLSQAASRLGESIETGQRDIMSATARLADGQNAIGAELKGLTEGSTRELHAVARSVEAKVGSDMADVCRVLDGVSQVLGDSLGQVASQQAHMAQAVMQLPQAAQATREMEQLKAALEQGLSGGLASIAEAIESAFRSYGEIIEGGMAVAEASPSASEKHAEEMDLDRRKLQDLAAQRWSSLRKSA